MSTVYFGMTGVQPHNQQFQNLFGSIAKGNAKKNELSFKILEQEVSKGRQVFDTMKGELQFARNKQGNQKRNFFERNKANANMVASKRETHNQENQDPVDCLGIDAKYTYSKRIVDVVDVGRQSYASGLRIQECVLNFVKNSSVRADGAKGVVILIEHDPVYTVGMRDEAYDVEYENRLRSLGADFFRTNRGGLVTFHGPGQLVVYPILNLNAFESNLRYVSLLEQVMISTCADFGVKADSSPGTRGVWVNDRKIGAIGVRFNQNITSHGLAFNCETDLNWFDKIDPCGIVGKGVTSLTVESQRRIRIADVRESFLKNFGTLFDCRLQYCTPEFRREILSKS